jgi:acyl carrier protein phosphodiesterase
LLIRVNCSFVGMNYLGHAYLSFNHQDILVGNMISDFVKGRQRFVFSGNIQKGIELHRNIDEYTDHHPATKKAMEIFRPAYRLYSGPIMDILYDHYLANDREIFDDEGLKRFSQETYKTLEKYAAQLPPRFLLALTYMRTEDWLYNYKFERGMQKSLAGLARRASYLSESETAYNLFLEHYVSLDEYYKEFFADVKRFAKQRFEELVLQ